MTPDMNNDPLVLAVAAVASVVLLVVDAIRRNHRG